MDKQFIVGRQVKSCRIGRNPHTRIVRSSQMPKDFFSRNQSATHLTKIRCSQQCEQDKHIFQQFKSMFKARKNLQSLALKFRPQYRQFKQPTFYGQDKQNTFVKLPSVYLNFNKHIQREDKLKTCCNKLENK